MPKIVATCPSCRAAMSIEVPENKKEGGKSMPDEGGYCPTCHQPHNSYPELIEARTELKDTAKSLEKLAAERDLVKQTFESANAELVASLKSLQYHIEHYPDGCHDGENCPTNQALHRIAQDAKKHLTPADLSIDLVADWLLERRAMGVARDGTGQRKIFTGIKTGGK